MLPWTGPSTCFLPVWSTRKRQHDAFPRELLTVGLQYHESADLIDAAFAQGLQRAAHGFGELAGHGALADAVAGSDIVDRPFVFADADAVDELLDDAPLTVRRRVETAVTGQGHLVPNSMAKPQNLRPNLLAGRLRHTHAEREMAWRKARLVCA